MSPSGRNVCGGGTRWIALDVLPLVEPRGFRLIQVGAFELKGIKDPVTILQAVRDDRGPHA
jgi:hypothetical protein